MIASIRSTRLPIGIPAGTRIQPGSTWTRRGYLSHLAFNVGPRHCSGAWLARMEAYETVHALLQLPNLRPNSTPSRRATWGT